jgi:hypothetical protein
MASHQDRIRAVLCVSLGVLALSIPVIAQSDNLVPFKVPGQVQENPAPAAKPPCAFSDLTLPSDFKVYAAGAYTGRRAGFQIDQSGSEASQIDVAVTDTSKPVVLMLGAYDPTIWNIGWAKGATILAVLASGYHRQVIAGLPKGTPTLVSTFVNRGACGYFYIQEERMSSLNSLSQRLFGRNVEMVYLAKQGTAIVGNAPLNGLITSTETPPESFFNPDAPLSGPAGLAQAVTKGFLRKATPIDISAWEEALRQANPNPDVPPISGERSGRSTPALHDTYVVLKPFQYPEGLYGGNSASFMILRGVPPPQGNPGHSAVYDLNSLTCQGARCGSQ